ncbi:MAG: hypothetical protein ABI182_03875 [Candidatus Baltobacteraceae bacterium]
MVHWIISETHSRRDEMLAQASQIRLLRLAQSERSSNIRGRIAEGAQHMSDLLANFAQVVRERN